MVTRTAMWLVRVGYTICVPLTFTVLWNGCLDIGGYGCHGNNLIIIILHGDGCLVWLQGLLIYCTCCSLAFLCPLIGVKYHFILLLLYGQHIATFISSCYGELYAMVVLRVAYHHRIWILYYSLLVARYQSNIILSLLYSWYIWRLVELSSDPRYLVKSLINLLHLK